MIELVKSKETGRPVAAPEAPRPSNVVNLMDALRKSIAAEPPAASKKAASKTSAERAPKVRQEGPSGKPQSRLRRPASQPSSKLVMP